MPSKRMSKRSQDKGAVRIISGTWRGRRLQVLSEPGLRPTSDRVRETLFNWLAPTLAGAHCLDLFAGSGVLGFEAASRGAAQVTMLESNHRVIAQLLKHKAEMQADVNIIHTDSVQWLSKNAPVQPFDIIFCDPPFGSNQLFLLCLKLLEQNGLSPDGYLYLEFPRNSNNYPLDLSCWSIIKQLHTQQVCAMLVTKSKA